MTHHDSQPEQKPAGEEVAKKTNQVQVEKAKAEEKSFARHDGRNITCT
jgi:hypothetical protein